MTFSPCINILYYKEGKMANMLFEYQTRRLRLRILKPDAASQVLNFYLRDRELFEKYEPDRIPQFYTVDHQRTILKCEYNLAFRLQNIRFYVYLKENPNLIIGTVCFHNISGSYYSSCEVGYKFSSAFWHHGYASEALEKGIEVMFDELNLHRIQAFVLPDNEPSIRLLESHGFKREGIARSNLFLQGEWRDHAQYSLIRE